MSFLSKVLWFSLKLYTYINYCSQFGDSAKKFGNQATSMAKTYVYTFVIR